MSGSLSRPYSSEFADQSRTAGLGDVFETCGLCLGAAMTRTDANCGPRPVLVEPYQLDLANKT